MVAESRKPDPQALAVQVAYATKPLSVRHHTEAYDSILNRLDSMKGRCRANAQTMADMLPDLAGLHAKLDSLADDYPKSKDHVTNRFNNTVKVCTERFTGSHNKFEVSKKFQRHWER